MRMNICRVALVAVALIAALSSPALAGDGPAPSGTAESDAVDPSTLAEGQLFTPAPTPTAPPCHFCNTTLTTAVGGGASHWGHGADCASAQSDVVSQLLAFTDSDCLNYGSYGRCGMEVVYTCSCYQQNGEWVVDAYANYRCWTDYCDPTGPPL